MVMKPGPFFEAVEAIAAKPPIVLLSPRGRRFGHADAVRYAAGEELTLFCGHYKDVDQRVADHLATEEVSLGDFVLSGGEAAALAVIDATVRLLPGAMSDLDSARGDSFFDRGISAPSYTRPPEFPGHTRSRRFVVGRSRENRRMAACRVRTADGTQTPNFGLNACGSRTNCIPDSGLITDWDTCFELRSCRKYAMGFQIRS